MHEQIYKGRKTIFVNNFIGGIAWALGATIGLSVVLAVLSIALRQLNLIPVIGTFILHITTFMEENSNLVQ